MQISYFKYLGLAFAAFLLTYFIGHLFYSFFTDKEESDATAEFKKNIFGLWIIVVVYSIVKTLFFTMSLGLVILFIASIILNKTNLKKRLFPINYNIIIFQSVVLVLIYTFLYFRLCDPFTNTLYNLQVDFSIYATNIHRMNLLNAETIGTDFYYKEPAISLYHYTELWYGAFLIWLFKMNALKCLYLVVWTYGLSVFSLGVLAVISYFKEDKKLSAWDYVLAVAALIISPVYFYFPKTIPFFNTDWGVASFFITPKFCFYGHSLLLATLYLLDKKYNKFFIVFLAGIFINPLGIPSILITGTVFIALLIYLKEIEIREVYKFIIPLFLSGIFLFVFNRLLVQHNLKYYQYAIINPIFGMLFSIKYYKLVFNNFAGFIIKLVISTFPFILILFITRKQISNAGTGKLVLFFLFLLALSAMLSFSIFYFLIDGIQILSVFYQSAMAILITVIFVFLLNQNKVMFSVFFPLYLLICVYQNIIEKNDRSKEDIHFIEEIKRSADDNPAINFGIFIKDTVAPKIAYGQNYNMYVPFDIIRLYFDNYQPIYLNAFDVPMSKDTLIQQYQQMFLQSSTFYKFVQHQKTENKFVSFEQSQLDLIKEANIRYIIKLRENKLPLGIDTLVRDKFFNKDSTYEFLILK